MVLVQVFYEIGKEEEMEVEIIDTDESSLVVDDLNYSLGRLFRDYCEGCRKQKQHREIRPRTFECTKCKRIKKF
ncbi:hypothetical protein V7152_15115 [Neobacillus drentensis]